MVRKYRHRYATKSSLVIIFFCRLVVYSFYHANHLEQPATKPCGDDACLSFQPISLIFSGFPSSFPISQPVLMFRLARNYERALYLTSRRPAAYLRAVGIPTASVTATTIPLSTRHYAARSQILDEQQAGEEPEELEKPKVKRTRKKKTDEESELLSGEQPVKRKAGRSKTKKTDEESELPTGEQPVKAKPKRASRKKADDGSAKPNEPRVLKPGVINFFADHPAAKQLIDTGIYTHGSRRRVKSKQMVKNTDIPHEQGDAQEKGWTSIAPDGGWSVHMVPNADRSRIHVVNEDLIKETIEYIAPTLKRHEGCDLVSLNPGVAIWDKALHEAIKPRSHLLLEPEAAFYEPFLKPLLEKEGVRVVPQSGIVWDELNRVLTPEYLPHQVEIDRDPHKPAPRNDTLLVTMNLAMNPKKRFGIFDSVSRLVVYQLIQSMRTSTLFQKYGKVRMLIWIPDDEKAQLLPRNVFHRTKLAVQGELTTEYIAEVVSHDKMLNPMTESKKSEKLRYGQMDLESVRQALVKMRDNGYKVPPGRKSWIVQQFEQMGLDLDTPIPLTMPITIQEKTTEKEYQHLLALKEAGKLSAQSNEATRLRRLNHYHTRQDREETRLFDWIRRYDAITQEYIEAERLPTQKERDEARAEVKKKENAFDAERDLLSLQMKAYTLQARDQLHMMRQPPEFGNVLNWDRRPWEPLVALPTDFFPNAPSCLLDIQPSDSHPLLRQAGPGSNNEGDIFDLLLSTLMWGMSSNVPSALNHVWPGTQSEIAHNMKSLEDASKGGVPQTGSMALTVRIANKHQLIDVVQEFIKWPFRPGYAELVGRLADVHTSDDVALPAATSADEAMGPLTEGFE